MRYGCSLMSAPEVVFIASAALLFAWGVPLIVYWSVVIVRIEQTLRGLPTGMDGVQLAEAVVEAVDGNVVVEGVRGVGPRVRDAGRHA